MAITTQPIAAERRHALRAAQRLPFFFYGTLRDADLLTTVLGRPLRALHFEPATLEGTCIVCAMGEAYPVLLPSPEEEAPGILVTGLGAREIERLDHYEGRDYRMVETMVATARGPFAAALFDSQPGIRPGITPWSLPVWQRRHKPAALAHVRSLMTGYMRRYEGKRAGR